MQTMSNRYMYKQLKYMCCASYLTKLKQTWKGVGSLTAEIGPIFGRFTCWLWSTFEKQVLN